MAWLVSALFLVLLARVLSLRVGWSGLSIRCALPACAGLLGVVPLRVLLDRVLRWFGVVSVGMLLVGVMASSGGPQSWCDVVFVDDEPLPRRGDPDHAAGAVLFEYPAGFAHGVMPAA